MQYAQKCADLIKTGRLFERNSLSFTLSVYAFGKEMMQTTSEWKNWDFSARAFFKQLSHPSQTIINQSVFVASCVLHRVFSGWCIMSMDLDGRTNVQKKYKNRLEIHHVFAIMQRIVASKRFVNSFSMHMDEIRDLMRLNDINVSKSTVTMSFPTHMLSEYRNLGFVF